MGVQIQPPGPAVSPVPAASLLNYGANTAPTAFKTLAIISSPPAGVYKVTVYPELSGTVSSSDEDNMRLAVDGTVLATIQVPAQLTTGGQGQPISVYVRTVGTSISVQAVAAGGASAVYAVLLIATKVA